MNSGRISCYNGIGWGTSFVTTAPAPTSAFSPMVIPHKMVALLPMEAPFFTKVSTRVQSASVWGDPSGLVARGNKSFVNITPCPIKQLSSICTPSQIKVWEDILQFLPMVAPF
jgi:hypothetical protein